MDAFNSAIKTELAFLVSDYAFSVAEAPYDPRFQSSQFEYASRVATIIASYNQRDGFDVWVAYANRGKCSLGTLLGALDVAEPSSDPTADASLRSQVRFLRRHLPQLQDPPSPILNDLLALRFFHAASWRPEWGRSVQMDDATIQRERARLARLREYFDASPSNVPEQPGT